MPSSVSNNKRIAKNTLILYFRMLLTMGVSLYTSRVILEALGVADYGIYNVVGGVVAMFGILSGSLSTAISRFITFELGKGNFDRLKRIFSTSVNIQIILIAIITVLMETIGLWFLNYKMVIPEGRMTAANWVFQFSVITFAINLLSVPYNAVIVAHEKMSAFAYISIVDCTLKLIVALIIAYNPFDRLVYYGLLIMIVGLINRSIYAIYSKRHFEEATYKFLLDKDLMKEMFGFAGWNFITSANHMLNNQGVNMLINIFFGVVFNAARAVAIQVETAVVSFVNCFTTAVNPQITKCYASGEYDNMYKLVCTAAKYSYFLMLMLALPLIFEADTVLNIWLKNVPEKAVLFVQLSLVLGMMDSIGSSGYTACMATGNLKKYTIVIGIIGAFEFPLTWILFFSSFAIESTYYVYILVKGCVLVARMFLLKELTGLKPKMYIKEVFLPIFRVTALSIIPLFMIGHYVEQSYFRLVLTIIVGLLTVGLITFFLGMTFKERMLAVKKVKDISSRITSIIE
ncbi:MAG: lipopolysaccharide biosynthesis protein [Paludibacteraceae bacterium]|nr:lipopolysaccharide biosynthesis protein [Paludibacteraceae bacterium]